MWRNRINGFFESGEHFIELTIPSLASEEKASPARAAAAGKSQSAFAQQPQRTQSLGAFPFAATSNAASPPAKGWCNYSI